MPEEKTLRTKHVAAQFKLRPVQLRRILRTMPLYADGVHTNYRWSANDAALPKIAQTIKEHEARKAKLAADAKAKLAQPKAA